MVGLRVVNKFVGFNDEFSFELNEVEPYMLGSVVMIVDNNGEMGADIVDRLIFDIGIEIKTSVVARSSVESWLELFVEVIIVVTEVVLFSEFVADDTEVELVIAAWNVWTEVACVEKLTMVPTEFFFIIII